VVAPSRTTATDVAKLLAVLAGIAVGVVWLLTHVVYDD
jgi:hypothetical protein